VLGSYVVEEFSGEIEAEHLLLKLAEVLLQVDTSKTIFWNICTSLQRTFGMQVLHQ